MTSRSRTEPQESKLDCTVCGACCVNSMENRAEDYKDYLPVEARDETWKRPDIVRRLVIYNAEGEPHLKLDPTTHRCVALHGRLGERVRCSIYAFRPTACRKVQAGDRRCLQARAELLGIREDGPARTR